MAEPPDPAVWKSLEMRRALADRDITTVYRLLGAAAGISQRRIAELTGQWQSEVSDILKGQRVLSYDVLARIAPPPACPPMITTGCHIALTALARHRVIVDRNRHRDRKPKPACPSHHRTTRAHPHHTCTHQYQRADSRLTNPAPAA